MIKKIFISLLIFFATLVLSAQGGMSVSSFRLLENDLTANTSGTMERDLSGGTTALIKVQTTQTGFDFEAGSLGIVKTMQQTGEIWVYVPRGSLKLTIRHPQLGVLRDYYYPCPIEAGRTYELCLVSGEVVSTVKKDKGGDMLAVTVQPNSANLYIDDRSVPLDNGQFTGFYPYGEHSYRVERSGYNSDAGHFTITSEGTTRLDISLEAAFATIRVECQTEGSEIYINQQKKGTTSYSEEVLDGTYLIEVQKQGYRTYQETVTLAEKEQRTVSVPALTPIYGSLMANYKPVNADIYIDGVKRGSSPEIIEDILVGEHEVRISMKGYSDHIERVTISENRQFELTGTLAVNLTSGAVLVGLNGSNDAVSISSSAGEVKSILSKYDCSEIKALTISGHIDANDFRFIKWNCTNLENLDISNAVIDRYKGAEGTNEGYDETYEANEIPLGAFFYWMDHRAEDGRMVENAKQFLDEGMPSLRSVKLPVGIKAIRRNAFARAYNLTRINIPEGVEIIDFVAFRYCTSLSEITLPSTLKKIGRWTFTAMPNLKEVHCRAMNPPATDESFGTIFDSDNRGYVYTNTYNTDEKFDTLYVPRGRKQAYSSWYIYFKNIIEE